MPLNGSRMLCGHFHPQLFNRVKSCDLPALIDQLWQKKGAIYNRLFTTSATDVIERRGFAHRELRKISHKMSKFQRNLFFSKSRPKSPNWSKSDFFGWKLVEIIIFPKFGPNFFQKFKNRLRSKFQTLCKIWCWSRCAWFGRS